MYLLDTNVISELRKPAKNIDKTVKSWAKQVPTNQLYISAITIMEIEIGILLKERKDKTQGAILRTWMESHVRPTFKQRTLPVDTAVAIRCARYHIPNRHSDRDAIIAATASVHGMTIVTRNSGDFDKTGVEILNPWLATAIQ